MAAWRGDFRCTIMSMEHDLHCVAVYCAGEEMYDMEIGRFEEARAQLGDEKTLATVH